MFSCCNQLLQSKLPLELAGNITTFWFELLFVTLQGLKYSFQTNDRLCFVMEYANGGEVNQFIPNSFCNCRHQYICILLILNSFYFLWTNQISLSFVCPHHRSPPNPLSFSSICPGTVCSQRSGHGSTAQR